MIAAVLADRRKLRARNTVFRWVRDQVAGGALRPMTRGLYINQLSTPRPTASEAAGIIRTGAIVSLQTVLGEAGVTNNFSDVVTSVLPHEPGRVSCVCEKSQVQALERTQPVLPMGLGYVEGVTHDYYRHGTTTLFAAWDVANGQVLAQCGVVRQTVITVSPCPPPHSGSAAPVLPSCMNTAAAAIHWLGADVRGP